MQELDAIATLASYRYSPDTARAILREAMTTGAVVRMGVRVTYSERYKYRVARADRTAMASRTRPGRARGASAHLAGNPLARWLGGCLLSAVKHLAILVTSNPTDHGQARMRINLGALADACRTIASVRDTPTDEINRMADNRALLSIPAREAQTLRAVADLREARADRGTERAYVARGRQDSTPKRGRTRR